MATIEKKRKNTNLAEKKQKNLSTASIKPSKGFEKAWAFWKTAQVDLSNFKFDRDE